RSDRAARPERPSWRGLFLAARAQAFGEGFARRLTARTRGQRRQADVLVEGDDVRTSAGAMGDDVFADQALDLDAERFVGHDIGDVLLELHGEYARGLRTGIE